MAVAMQVAEVNKTLGSAFRMNQCGNVIVLDGDNSYFVNKGTGRKTKIYQENGQFVFNIWTKAPGRDMESERGTYRRDSSGDRTQLRTGRDIDGDKGHLRTRQPVRTSNRFEVLGEGDDMDMDFMGQEKGRR